MDKPGVTDEHLKKYSEIMKTPTPTGQPAKPEEKAVPTADTKTEPQPTTNPGASDLTSKGFVFTGKKIMSLDGKEKKQATIPGAKKHSSTSLLIIVGAILLVAWTIFWAFFFGYIKF